MGSLSVLLQAAGVMPSVRRRPVAHAVDEGPGPATAAATAADAAALVGSDVASAAAEAFAAGAGAVGSSAAARDAAMAATAVATPRHQRRLERRKRTLLPFEQAPDHYRDNPHIRHW